MTARIESERHALLDLLDGITAVPSEAPSASETLTMVPPALDLFDFQQEAVEHVLRDHGKNYGYVALDMGLGKTPVGITLAASAAAVRDTPVLVIVPPSLRINWVREFAKFAPWLTVETLEGAKPQEPVTVPTTDVVVMGDSQLAGWAEHLVGKVRDFIIDEAHRMKNKSGRTRAMQALAESCDGLRVLMSGTPLPNGRHTELDQQVSIMGSDAWWDIGGKGRFYTHYAPVIDQRYGTRTSAHQAELHSALTSTWMFRRQRDEVLEMPNKGRTAIAIDGQGKAKRDYVRAEDDLIQWLSEEGLDWKGAARAEALVRLTTLRRLAGATKIKGTVEHVKEVLDSLGDEGGVFVVAEHKDTIDGLLNGLARFNPVTVRGGMTDSAKSAAVDAFTSGNSRVMVGQITAAGVGLTLHGGGINHRVVVAQLPWTPAELRQAEDRLHRIGQTHDVEVEVCMAAIEGRWTIDERLWGTLEAKAFSAGEIIDGEGEVLLEEIVGGVLDSYR